MLLPCVTKHWEWQFQELKPREKIAWPCLAPARFPSPACNYSFQSPYTVCAELVKLLCQLHTYIGI